MYRISFILFLCLIAPCSLQAEQAGSLAGWHIGAHVGTQFFNTKMEGTYAREAKGIYRDAAYSLDSGQSRNISATSFIGGFDVKYLWDFSTGFFWGAGASIDFNSLATKKKLNHSGKVTSVVAGLGVVTTDSTVTIQHKIKNPYNFRTMVLLGYYLNDDWSVYGTAGPNIASYSLSTDIDDPEDEPVSKKKNKTLLGFDMGIGFAYQLSSHTVMTVEVNYSISQKYKNGTFTSDSALTYIPDFNPNKTTLMLGISYKF